MVATPAPELKIEIDESLLVICPELPEDFDGTQSENLYMLKTVTSLYGYCARKDDRLVQTVEKIIKHQEKVDE